MTEKVSRDELLEGYCKFENIDEYFKSDILIIPAHKEEEGIFNNQFNRQSFIKEFPDISVNYYCSSQESRRCYISASVQETHFFWDNVVLLTPYATHVLQHYLKTSLKYVKIDGTISIKIFAEGKVSLKKGNKEFIRFQINGKGSDIEKEISEVLTEKE